MNVVKMNFKFKKLFYISVSIFFLVNFCQATEGGIKVESEKNIETKTEGNINEKKRKENAIPTIEGNEYEEYLKELELAQKSKKIKTSKNDKIGKITGSASKKNENVKFIEEKSLPVLMDFNSLTLQKLKKELGSGDNKIVELFNKNPIYLKFNDEYGETEFGALLADAETNDNYINELSRNFNETFDKYQDDLNFKNVIIIIKELLEKYDANSKEFNTRFFLKIARSFRHLIFNNPCGDFVSEYILIYLLNILENKTRDDNEDQELSEIYYDLSQIYFHITSPKYKKIKWNENKTKGFLTLNFINYDGSYNRSETLKDFDKISFDYSELKKKRLNLLRRSLSLNQKFSPSWTRVIEFYFYENEDKENNLSKLEKENIFYFCQKWSDANEWYKEKKKPGVYFIKEVKNSIDTYCQDYQRIF